ncbi:hypothetical protein ACIQVO_07180 [Streptomyces sp. NPDC101062]|uniref:hypothetical protein n=1 Tax=unclassified Streptomyces TaxID=2593676 RepID=UPI00380B560E
MPIAVLGADGPTGRHLTDQALAAGHEVRARCGDPEERRYVRTAMGVITTAVKPDIAKLIRNKGVRRK